MEEGIVVPQIDGTHGNLSNAQAPAIAALTGDMSTDLANVAKEMGIPLDRAGNVAQTPAAQPPVTPPPVPVQAAPVQPVNQTPVEVPPKFQNPDGTANVEKVEKSIKSIEEMLAYYKGKEKEAQQVQNRVNNPAPAPQPLQPQAPSAQPLEIQVANDILSETSALISQGYQPQQAQALATARVQVRLQEARYAAERNDTAELRREINEGKMTTELRDLMAADENLLTPEVADRVLAIKAERGGNYRDAYIQHLGEEAIRQRTGQVKTPNPTGPTVKAPPTPVGPVSRVQSTFSLEKPQTLSDADLEAAVRAAFPRYRGLNK